MDGMLGRTCPKIVSTALFVAFALVGSGCATFQPSRGRSGPVEWEILNVTTDIGIFLITVALRETAGVGVSFDSLKIDMPGFPPSELRLVRRLEPHSDLRLQIPVNLLAHDPPSSFELEFRGVDDASTPIKVTLRGNRQPAIGGK